ncbi:MAG: MBL fold metallo-hydrolase [archaeon]
MIIEQLRVGPLANFCYLVGDAKTKTAAAIDPGFEADAILAKAKQRGLKIKYLILTHSHLDHTGELSALKEATGAVVVMGALESGDIEFSAQIQPDIAVRDGDELKLGGTKLKFIHTPGHTPGSMCILAENNLFTGDLLFDCSIGRTDLTGSDEGQMTLSLKKVSKLPDKTMVWPGHDYGAKKHFTLGEQKKESPFLKA